MTRDDCERLYAEWTGDVASERSALAWAGLVRSALDGWAIADRRAFACGEEMAHAHRERDEVSAECSRLNKALGECAAVNGRLVGRAQKALDEARAALDAARDAALEEAARVCSDVSRAYGEHDYDHGVALECVLRVRALKGGAR